MIGYLSGKILVSESGKWIIDVNGVGYRVMVSTAMFASKEVGNQVSVNVYTHVKEDALALYGFESRDELTLFEMLLSVSGIGPKMALNVLNAGNAAAIRAAIRAANVEFFTAVSGIGKKGAQRLIVELKSKLGDSGDVDLSDYPEKQDAMRGLVELGYTKAEASEALKKVDGRIKAEEQIRQALKHG